MEPIRRRRVALILNESEAANGRILAGVAALIREQSLPWHLLLPLATRPGDPGATDNAVAALAPYADAVIAASDLPGLHSLPLPDAHLILLDLGGARPRDDARALTVRADNAVLAQRAYDYLIAQGAHQFAVFCARPELVDGPVHEREQAFAALVRADRASLALYRRDTTRRAPCATELDAAIAWLDSLPRPIAIFAADASRARLLTQACALAGYDTASDVLIVGVDCDTLDQDLSTVPLASLLVDRHELGRAAAAMLQCAFEASPTPLTRLVAPMALVRPPQEASALPYHPQVTRALHFIRLNAQRGIKAEQVAHHVRMSRSALETRFKREVGRSVHDEILRLKLEEAKELLRGGADSMLDVAVSCGFTSVQYLYTVFAREVGCTPRVWQENVLKAPLILAA